MYALNKLLFTAAAMATTANAFLLNQQSHQRMPSLASTAADDLATTYSLDGQPIRGPITPLSNFLLVQTREAMGATTGGLFLPDKAKERPTDGKVVTAGPGRIHPTTGVLMENKVVPGEYVMFGKFDGVSIDYCSSSHQLVREDDVLFVYKVDSESDTIPKLKNIRMNKDCLLVEVTTGKEEKESLGGIVLAAGSDTGRICEGKVVMAGPGRMSSLGETVPNDIKEGDFVKFREYAGSDVRIESSEFQVVKMIDCLAKW